MTHNKFIILFKDKRRKEEVIYFPFTFSKKGVKENLETSADYPTIEKVLSARQWKERQERIEFLKRKGRGKRK